MPFTYTGAWALSGWRRSGVDEKDLEACCGGRAVRAPEQRSGAAWLRRERAGARDGAHRARSIAADASENSRELPKAEFAAQRASQPGSALRGT